MTTEAPGSHWPVARRVGVTGTVVSFDAARGVGVVADAAGAELPFHCSAITDGSREIDVGRPVSFVVRPTHGGRLEARRVEKR
jgi:cold shock CspA family protein